MALFIRVRVRGGIDGRVYVAGGVVACHSVRCLKNDGPSHMHNHTQATDA